MSKESEFTQIIKDHEGVIFKTTTIYTDNHFGRCVFYCFLKMGN